MIEKALLEVRQLVDALLAEVIRNKRLPASVAEMVRYASLGEGKRLRPALVIWSAQAVGGTGEKVLRAAAGIECLHAFSLVHDDLPGLDDAPMRRGQPSVHRAYGLGEAILVGDALLALGMELIAADAAKLPGGQGAGLLEEAGRAVGLEGMIGGQFDDIRPRERDDGQWMDLDARKTSCLFQLSLRLGATLAGADPAAIEMLERYGYFLGLAFQLTDDLLDLDNDDGPSWARMLGEKTAWRRAGEMTAAARVALSEFPGERERFWDLLDFLLERSK